MPNEKNNSKGRIVKVVKVRPVRSSAAPAPITPDPIKNSEVTPLIVPEQTEAPKAEIRPDNAKAPVIPEPPKAVEKKEPVKTLEAPEPPVEEKKPEQDDKINTFMESALFSESMQHEMQHEIQREIKKALIFISAF